MTLISNARKSVWGSSTRLETLGPSLWTSYPHVRIALSPCTLLCLKLPILSEICTRVDAWRVIQAQGTRVARRGRAILYYTIRLCEAIHAGRHRQIVLHLPRSTRHHRKGRSRLPRRAHQGSRWHHVHRCALSPLDARSDSFHVDGLQPVPIRYGPGLIYGREGSSPELADRVNLVDVLPCYADEPGRPDEGPGRDRSRHRDRSSADLR